MPTRRQQRVGDQLREVISELIRQEISDPRIEGVTIMDVVIDRELEVANVYVNALRGETARKDVLRALEGASGYLRKEVGRRVRLQNTPELRFHWDELLAEADKIEKLLASIKIPPPNEQAEKTMTAIDDAATLIRVADHIAVATHVAPDPDAIGSLLAIGHGLKLLGKETLLLCDDPVPEKLRFLPGSQWVESSIKPNFSPQLFIGVDASDRERLGSVAQGLLNSSIPILNIDHHITNLNFGTVNLVVPESAATCEAMLLLFHNLSIPLTVEISTCLMAGLVGDTRSFSTSSTTAHTLEAAARLVNVGADIATITEYVFNQRSLNALKLWGIGLSNLVQDGDILWTAITLAERARAGSSDSHDLGLGNVLLSASEANIAAVFLEQPNHVVDISFRARPGHNVATTALTLGGGGHALAAGCKLSGKLDDVISKTLATLKSRRNGTSNGG